MDNILRPLEDNDLEMILEWRNHPQVREKMYTTHEISLEEHLAWWTKISLSPKDLYFIFQKEGRDLGVISFNQIDKQAKCAAWAFYSAYDAPKGTGSLMELYALDYAFEKLELNKLWCEVLSFNQSVIRLHKKFGFQEEGRFVEQHFDELYGLVDIYRLAIFYEQWQIHRPELLKRLIK